VEFSQPPSCTAAWFDSLGSEVDGRHPLTPTVEADQHQYLLSFWSLLNRGTDSETKKLVDTLNADFPTSDRPSLIGIYRVPILRPNESGVSTTKLLVDFAGIYAEHRYPNQSEKRNDFIVVHIDRQRVVAAWPESEIELADLEMKSFTWPKNGTSLADATPADLHEAMRKKLQWQKAVVEKPIVLLCGEIPTIVFRLNNGADLARQWQSDIKTVGIQQKLTVSDFAWNPPEGDFSHSIADIAKSDPIFRPIFRELLPLVGAADEGAKTGQPPSQLTQREFTELTSLRNACSNLQGILRELNLENTERQIILLPYML
jgi:hypothetical protein